MGIEFEKWLETHGDPEEAYEFNHRAFREWRSRQAMKALGAQAEDLCLYEDDGASDLAH